MKIEQKILDAIHHNGTKINIRVTSKIIYTYIDKDLEKYDKNDFKIDIAKLENEGHVCSNVNGENISYFIKDE